MWVWLKHWVCRSFLILRIVYNTLTKGDVSDIREEEHEHVEQPLESIKESQEENPASDIKEEVHKHIEETADPVVTFEEETPGIRSPWYL